uniref:PX domain-containing protein n=1 Tax=Denticeps clupeoides TaxID=299321 RepID=A0AAY4BS46_9TELE
MSRKTKEEYHRFFSVTDPRTHEKGHTEYKVTARFVSKKRPEDVKEVVVWRRYSELKKLHSELAYTHRNLFRRQEEFPPFPPAQLFGRFDEAVIEERRKASEIMFDFTTNIPALYNSPQLKEFFQGGEVTRPLDPCPVSTSLPPPLIPLPERISELLAEEEEGKEAPIQPQELDSVLGPEVGKPEVALEAYTEDGNSPVQIVTTDEEVIPVLGTDENQQLQTASPQSASPTTDQSEGQEEFDSLFDSVARGPADGVPPALSNMDLAMFDPCAKEGMSLYNSELLSLAVTNESSDAGGEAAYLTQVTNELNAAMEKEKAGDYSAAILQYRTAVDILIRGVQGDPDPHRRDSVKRRTAQYLQHVENLLRVTEHTQSQAEKT